MKMNEAGKVQNYWQVIIICRSAGLKESKLSLELSADGNFTLCVRGSSKHGSGQVEEGTVVVSFLFLSCWT